MFWNRSSLCVEICRAGVGILTSLSCKQTLNTRTGRQQEQLLLAGLRLHILLGSTAIFAAHIIINSGFCSTGRKKKDTVHSATVHSHPRPRPHPTVSRSSVKAPTRPRSPGHKHDMKYECEQHCVSERRERLKLTRLSTVH